MSKLNRRTFRALFLGGILSTGMSATVFFSADDANSDSVKVLQQRLDQSIKMIETLAGRVRELEAKQLVTGAGTYNPLAAGGLPAGKSTPSPKPTEEARLQAVEQQISQIEIANAARQGDDRGLAMHGFADVNIGNHNLSMPTKRVSV